MFHKELFNGDGVSDLDRELACFRIKLEKKWGNDHDGAVVYIYADGTKFIYIDNPNQYDGIATITQPPNMLSFDPAKCGPSLLVLLSYYVCVA